MSRTGVNGTATLPGSVGADDLTERLLDTDEVAAWLNVTPAWVQETARSGGMPAFKLGDRYWRFSKAQVARWLIERQERVHERRTG